MIKIYLTKAKSRNRLIKILSKTSKIRVFIYRRDIYNLQTKVVSFTDQEKLLKKVVFSVLVFNLAFINANAKNSEIKYCPCPRYVVI